MNNCPNENIDCVYQEALNKIKHDQKYKPTCCTIIGPTGPAGPTGPTGPATITVGTTTIGQPGSNPSVTNVGTNQNTILNFVIPAGPTGPTGATGITGPIGPTA